MQKKIRNYKKHYNNDNKSSTAERLCDTQTLSISCAAVQKLYLRKLATGK